MEKNCTVCGKPTEGRATSIINGESRALCPECWEGEQAEGCKAFMIIGAICGSILIALLIIFG